MTAFSAFNQGVFALEPARLPAARDRYSADPRLRDALHAVAADPELAGYRPESVAVDKMFMPPSGDPRDYSSLGTYWHPDPDSPDGLPYIRRDGHYNPVTRDPRNDLGKMSRMAANAFAWAAVAFFEDDRAAAERAVECLRVWFVDPATRMNPHLEYAQAIPGLNHGRGIGIIDTVRLIRAANAVLLLSARPGAEADDAVLAEVRSWFGGYLEWMLASGNGRDEQREHNNHGTWYEAQVLTFASVSGRREAVPESVRRLRTHAAKQIVPDGAMPHELGRTRSWSYSCFNLAAFLAARTAAEALGEPVGAEADAAIRRAVDWTMPYAAGEKEWAWPQLDGFDPGLFRPPLAVAARAWPEAGYAARLAASGEVPPTGCEFF